MSAISYSNSRLTTFRRCRLKYHWHYVENQSTGKSYPLARGAAAHLAMAAYYRGKSPREATAIAWEDFGATSDKSLKRMEELDAVLTRYFAWAVKNDYWKVQLVEETVEVKYNGVKLMGIWDLLVKKEGRLYIVDHKFQKSHSFANLEVDPQVTHYLTLARLLGYKVDGLIYNIINLETGATKNIAMRQTASRADYFIQTYLDSLAPQVKEMKKADKQTLPIYPNWTKDCCWDCNFYRRCIDEPHEVVT
jgi:hypothetical protein